MTDRGRLERIRAVGRTSLDERLTRLRTKSWHIGQCAVAAALAWYLAHDVVGHERPFFAPIVAVICLGTSYGQRLRRVAEVTLGVAVGVFLADLLLLLIGTGAWQVGVLVALSMTVTLLLNAGNLFVTQAAVQGIVVVTFAATPGYALTRWADALIGGAVAAALAWYLAHDVVGHERPFFAPIVAVICLGTSYGQRLRRVAEVTLGVAVGVFLADLLLLLIGTGAWQVGVLVALSMTVTLLLNAGNLFVTQAAVQGIVVVTFAATPGYALTRWADALIGGAVALVAAAVVPRAPLRRPREQAAVVVRRIAELLRTGVTSAREGDVDRGLAVLAAARSTDRLMRELQAAADEGLSVLASSPFRRRQGGDVRRMAEIVDPLDLALRNTRVLVRRMALTTYHRTPLPHSYLLLCEDLADAVDEMAAELCEHDLTWEVRTWLLRIGEGTAEVERVADLSADVVLAQIRSIVVDLLRITGLDVLEATDALPPPRV